MKRSPPSKMMPSTELQSSFPDLLINVQREQKIVQTACLQLSPTQKV